jgi:AcrR family transcriptional regulator
MTVMGRPRAFDMDKALDEAMEVFWRHGFEGATIAELTGAMDINPPSLYAAFGSKEGLLKAALDHYSKRRDECMTEVLAARRARTEDQLRERFERARAEDDLPADADPAALARYLSAVIVGMGVLASSGASRNELHEVARVSLRAFDERAGAREAKREKYKPSRLTA